MSISTSHPNAAAATSRSDSIECVQAPSTSSSQSSSSSSTVSGGTARRQHQSLIFTTPSDVVAQTVAHSSQEASSSSSTRSSPSSSALPIRIPAQAPADGPASTPPRRRKSAPSRPQSYARSYPLSHALRVSSFGIAAGRPDPQSPHTPKVTVHVDSRPLMPGVFVTEEVRNALWEDIQRRRAGASAATAPHRAQAPLPIPHTFLASAFSAAPPPIDSFSQDTNFLTPSMAHQSAHSIAHMTSPEQSPSRQVAWGAPKTWADMAARKNGAASATFQGYLQQGHGVAQSPLGSSAGVDTPSATQSSITSPSNKSAQTYSSNHSAANTSTTSLPLTAGLAPAFVPQCREPERSYAKMSRTTDLAPLLADSHLRLEAPLTVPRGLINTGNLCFANSILQVLVYCAPFYNLFDLLGKVMPADFGNLTPLIEASIQFLREFRVVPPQYTMATSQGGYPSPSRVDPLAEAQLQSEPFIPEFVYDAMRLNKRFDTMRRGHQEDAEEFLGFFLDTLHEELLSALRRSQPRATGAAVNGAPKVNGIPAHEGGSTPSDEGEDAVARDVERPVSPRNEEDVWMEVGQKGKTSFTRTTSTSESPITHIFGGKLRSVLRVPGAKGSVTLEPYQALQLDIAASHVQTVEDAIRNLAAPETVHGVRPTPTAASTVDATKQVYIESMPQILVLHLKRFGYDEVGGTIKNSKEVRYGKTLVVSDEVLSPAVRADRKKYNLFGVVYHHGRFATGGHYTVDVLRQDASTWLHIDDTAYYPVPAEQVHYGVSETSGSDGVSATASASRMQRTHDGHAYLLFYQRESSAPAASEGGQAGQHVSSATFASSAMRASPHQQQQRYAQGGLGPAFVPGVTAPHGVTPFTAAFEERGSGGRASHPSSVRSSPRASGSGGAVGDTSKGAAGGGNPGRVPANGWKAAPAHKAKGSGGSGSQSPSSSKRAGGTGGSGGSGGIAPASPVKGSKAGASSTASPVPAVKPPVPGAPPPSPAQIKAQKKYAAAMAAKEREGREKSTA